MRDIENRMFAPEAWIAIVRIERYGDVLADWHLPRFAGRWASAAGAQRDGLEYATRLVKRGVPGPSVGVRALTN
ncbi:hypothetical protein J8I87_28610 [Paraburkholderia sp. LEh10]|uniref:DUF6566 family protein n=1 Tax=Paraburkholderia sp. LEh10 TaxID=2821353 RepID=UPI001AE765E3|nr:DUF6566 family protein [Paraburkholderia sp. LEh10]MBP0593584.1 hypothetical protein [Paraburkholderia sp. LEh10]